MLTTVIMSGFGASWTPRGGFSAAMAYMF